MRYVYYKYEQAKIPVLNLTIHFPTSRRQTLSNTFFCIFNPNYPKNNLFSK